MARRERAAALCLAAPARTVDLSCALQSPTLRTHLHLYLCSGLRFQRSRWSSKERPRADRVEAGRNAKVESQDGMHKKRRVHSPSHNPGPHTEKQLPPRRCTPMASSADWRMHVHTHSHVLTHHARVHVHVHAHAGLRAL